MDQNESTGGMGRDDISKGGAGLGGTGGAFGSAGGSGMGTGSGMGSGLGGSTAGAANTPSFDLDQGAVATAADHQIPSETGPANVAGTGTSGTQQGEGEGQGGMNQLREQAANRVNQGMQQAAERLETVAKRIDDLADQRLGSAGRAGDVAHGVADNMESLAGYLRESDLQTLQRDLERQVRERPMQTLLVAVAVGWIAGKILR